MTIKTDPCTIQSAQSWFSLILSDLQIAELPVIGRPSGIKLKDMLKADQWLGVLMLYSDEISAFVNEEQRLWDVVYAADRSCLQGVAPKPTSDIPPGHPVLPTYSKYSVMGLTSDESYSRRYQIVRQAVQEKLDIDKDGVSILPVSGIYNLNKPLDHGDILPFPDSNSICWAIFRDKLTSAAAAAEFIAEFNPEFMGSSAEFNLEFKGASHES
jgi:hypothetical protein